MCVALLNMTVTLMHESIFIATENRKERKTRSHLFFQFSSVCSLLYLCMCVHVCVYLLYVCLRVQLAFQHVASAARTAKLVQNVAEGEIENTEDPTFKANLTAAKDHVAQCTYDLAVCIYH